MSNFDPESPQGWLVVAEVARGCMIQPLSNGRAGPAPLTLLVIDDLESVHEIVRYAAAYITADQPVQVYSALSAQQGLDLVHKHADSVRIVLLDARMPRSDGRWLIPSIHRHAPQAMIIPFTIDTAAASTMQELGCLEPIPKPISARELANRIEALLAQPRQPMHFHPEPPRTPWYSFVQEHADDALAARTADRPRLLVALLGSSGYIRLGLRAVLDKVAQYLPLEILIESSSMYDVRHLAQRRRISLIIAAADMAHDAETVGELVNVPVLVLGSALDVANVAVGPATSVVGGDPLQHLDLLVDSVERAARGDTVRSEHRALRELTTPQRQVVELTAQGYSIAEIADHLKIRRDRVDHILGELYRLSDVPYGWKAFRQWAKRVASSRQLADAPPKPDRLAD